MTPLTEIPILNTSFPHVRYYLVVILISYRSTALAKFIPEIWQHVAAMQSKGPRNMTHDFWNASQTKQTCHVEVRETVASIFTISFTTHKS